MPSTKLHRRPLRHLMKLCKEYEPLEQRYICQAPGIPYEVSSTVVYPSGSVAHTISKPGTARYLGPMTHGCQFGAQYPLTDPYTLTLVFSLRTDLRTLQCLLSHALPAPAGSPSGAMLSWGSPSGDLLLFESELSAWPYDPVRSPYTYHVPDARIVAFDTHHVVTSFRFTL